MSLTIPYENLDEETQNRIERLGFIQLTPDAKDILDETETELTELFRMYANQMYGQVTTEEAFQNDRAVYMTEGRCRAVYVVPNGKKIVVETIWNQPVTRILSLDEEV